MASSLLSSPPEILSMVFAYLDWTDHLALALTHRTLRPLADSILYSRIKWAWYSPWTPPILKVLRTITQRPQLAKLVNVVILKGHYFEYEIRHDDKNQTPRIAVEEDDLKPLIKCVTRTNMSYRDEWIEDLHNGTIDAVVALLLSQLPRLRDLYLGENITRQCHFVGRVLRSSLCEKGHHFHSF
jgi:hypothetical protein